MKSLVTIVIPCYNEEEALPLFMDAVNPVREALLSSSAPADTELIFVNDGSTDRTQSLLEQYNLSDPSVRYIAFSRNFGKEAAIYAGLEASKGDYVVLLDADLQHPPQFIPEMYEALQDDTLDSVAMYRRNRKGEAPVRSFFSKRFYRVINRLSKLDLVDGATDYRMMKRTMVDAVLSMQEYNRFTKGIFNWVGFNTRWLPYDNVQRSAGSTKWSFFGLVRYSLDGLFAFSTTPLTICFVLGVIFCILALIYAVIVAVRTLIWGDPVAGFPTLFCTMLFLGGVQLLFIGIQGQYLSRMYMEVKKRPVYIIKKKSDE